MMHRINFNFVLRLNYVITRKNVIKCNTFVFWNLFFFHRIKRRNCNVNYMKNLFPSSNPIGKGLKSRLKCRVQ